MCWGARRVTRGSWGLLSRRLNLFEGEDVDAARIGACATLVDREAPEERRLFAGFDQARRRRYGESLVWGREDVAGGYAGHPHCAFCVDVDIVDGLGSGAGDVARIDEVARGRYSRGVEDRYEAVDAALG